MTGVVSLDNCNFMWQQVIMPRCGDVYVFGGSLNPNAVQVGTDCTGACSEVCEALLYGAQMNWNRQFWTGTFEGATVGSRGPFGAVACTSEWVCVDSPHDVPAGVAMIISVLQDPNPEDAHMVCAVLDPNNVTGFGGPGKYVGIESGGEFVDPNGNSTLHIGGEATSIYSGEFNQWFYLDRIVSDATVLTPLEENAITIMNAGLAQGITPVGIQLAFACVYDESNFTMYANVNVPESQDYPHDAEGSDHESCGPFQQQPDEGWGTVACEMDWGCSAGLFFTALARTDYTNENLTPGERVQAVQNSGDPTGANYQAQWDRAVALYNSISTVQDEGFLMALADQQQTDLFTWIGDLHGALFNSIGSTSAFRKLGEGAVLQQHQLPINDDGFLHPQWMEWAASHGSVQALSDLEALATGNVTEYPDRAADIALAGAALARVQAALQLSQNGAVPTPSVHPAVVPAVVPVAPAVVPAPAVSSGINVSQLISYAKDAVTVAGALGTWLTAIHGLLGQFLPGTSGTVIPAMLATATTISAGHTVARQRLAQRQVVALTAAAQPKR